jgi:hypothetical protein
MKNLINAKEIISKTTSEVEQEVISLLNRKGFTAGSKEELKNFFDGEKYYSNSIQKLQIDGEMNGDWQTTITVIIYENYVDSGSDDYFYTIKVSED